VQPDPKLWVSADIPASSDEQHLLETQHALIAVLRDMMTAAGVDPADGQVMASLLPMRKVTGPGGEGMFAGCGDIASADMVRLMMDYQPTAYWP
jgi:hypothetical protein